MVKSIDLLTHPDFTVDQIIQYTGWKVPTPAYKENMRKALEYLQKVASRQFLRAQDNAGPWNFYINGIKIKLLNYLQGIDFNKEVNPHRLIRKGSPVIAYTLKKKDPGSWYTFPSTQQDDVAIHSNQTTLHKFKAKNDFICMQSSIADAHVSWLHDLPSEYRHGGGAQLFIWNASKLLERL